MFKKSHPGYRELDDHNYDPYLRQPLNVPDPSSHYARTQSPAIFQPESPYKVYIPTTPSPQYNNYYSTPTPSYHIPTTPYPYYQSTKQPPIHFKTTPSPPIYHSTPSPILYSTPPPPPIYQSTPSQAFHSTPPPIYHSTTPPPPPQYYPTTPYPYHYPARSPYYDIPHHPIQPIPSNHLDENVPSLDTMFRESLPSPTVEPPSIVFEEEATPPEDTIIIRVKGKGSKKGKTSLDFNYVKPCLDVIQL